MSRINFCCPLLFLLLIASGCAGWSGKGNTLARSGDWPQFRGDRTLTGRSPLKGDIHAPRIAWKQFIGGRETLCALQLTGQANDSLPLPATDLNLDQHAELLRQWKVGAPWYDLDGDGQLFQSGPNLYARMGRLFPERPDNYCVVMTLGQQPDSQTPHPCTGELQVRRNKIWETVWRHEQLVPAPYGMNTIVDDFDNDGQMEFAVTPMNDMYVFDLATGQQKAKCAFVQKGAESGRPYGWFGAYDLNGDGTKEFILIGDFQEHLEVMGWRDGQLQLLWGCLIEADITGKDSLVHIGVNPIQDIDGDGQREIIFSIYNQTSDQRWHTYAYDGMTGKTKYDLPDWYLSGLDDLDGDGVMELLCTRARQGRLVPEVADLSVISLKGGRQAERWHLRGSAFQPANIQDFPLNVNSCGTTPTGTILTGPVDQSGARGFVTRRVIDLEQGLVELSVWRSGGKGAIEQVARVRGLGLDGKSLQGEKGLLVAARAFGTREQSLALHHAAGQCVASLQLNPELSAVVAGRLLPAAAPTALVQGACERMLAVDLPGPAATAPLIRWNVPGRGIYQGSSVCAPHVIWGGVMLADLNGDGRQETVVASRGDKGQARLEARNARGGVLWHADFADFPGAPPPWNLAGLTFWHVGHFTDPNRFDVLVTVRPNQDSWTSLLDGRTGKVLWTRKAVRPADYGWKRTPDSMHPADRIESCGGAWMAMIDYDGDGLEDPLIEFHDIIYVMKGSTGEVLKLWDTSPGGLFGDLWLFGGMPTVADFLGHGGQQLLFWNSSRIRALLDLQGKILWDERSDYGALYVFPGVGDLDGDGRLDVVNPGNTASAKSDERLLKCHDGLTGKVKWTLDLPAPGANPVSPSTADVDSDGRDECLLPVGDTLYAVGSDQAGAKGIIKWQIKLPGMIGPVAITNDQAGSMQLLTVCADGNLYAIAAQ